MADGYDKIILKLDNGKHKLVVDITELQYDQILRKCDSINKSLKLGLRKVGGCRYYARRVNGEWDFSTSIEFSNNDLEN